MKKYDVISDRLVKEILDNAQTLVGVTGTSSIGKSTLTKVLKGKMEERYQVTVIDVDSYLKEEFRGGKNFWNRVSEYLKPEYFDWKTLAEDVVCLRAGDTITRQKYVRGNGWESEVTYKPADYYIIEGLFLDSVQAAQYLEYDRVFVLSAPDEYVYNLRMKRDDYYRQNFPNFTRTKEGTVKEIESTLKAGKAYSVDKEKWLRTEIFVQDDSCKIINDTRR